MAKDIKIIFSGDSSRADAAIKSLENSGKQAASILEREFNQLGMKSALAFDNQRLAADKAYARIKSSGLATAGELERAQKNHASAILRIDEEQHGKRIAMLDKFKANWLAVTAGIAAAWAIANKAMTLAQEGAAFQQQGQSFANLAAANGVSADKLIADLRRVSGETVSVQQLVEKSGTAMLTGINADMLPKLMEIAKASSRITGQTVTAAFDSISIGLARMSKLKLDDLGILVDVEKANKAYAEAHNLVASALTEAEKKQAFFNATLLAGQKIIDDTGSAAETDADKMAKFSASIDDIGKSVGILLSGPMASLAAEMSATVGWLEAYKSGQVGFWEWATTGAEAAAEKLKTLRKTAFDASVTPEGKALAQRRIETAAREAAELEAKTKKEATAKALVEASAAREKELIAIRKHNDKILDVEKKRISQSLNLESGHLQKIVSNYESAVKAMDSLIDARAAVRDQLASRNAADLAKGQTPKDALNTYLDQQDAIKTAEEKIANSFGLSAEAKAKAYADLIDSAATYNQAVIDNGVEIISTYQTEADYLATKETLTQRITDLLDTEAAKRTATAEDFASQMIAAEERVSAFKSEVENLETILDRMNNKEVNIIFKATDAAQILAAGGMGSAKNYVTDESSPNFIGPTRSVSGLPTSDISTPFGAGFHTGTGYVPRSGLYPLARGEQVLNRNEARAAQGGSQTVNLGGIHISGVSASGAEKTARELAREIEPELRKLAGRYR
jgi:hypothetical protein